MCKDGLIDGRPKMVAPPFRLCMHQDIMSMYFACMIELILYDCTASTISHLQDWIMISSALVACLMYICASQSQVHHQYADR